MTHVCLSLFLGQSSRFSLRKSRKRRFGNQRSTMKYLYQNALIRTWRLMKMIQFLTSTPLETGAKAMRGSGR